MRSRKALRQIHGLHLRFGNQGLRARHIRGRKRPARNQNRILRSVAVELGGIVAHHHHVAGGIGLAHARERVHRERDQPQRFARRIETPARKGQQSVICQMRKVVVKGVRGVQMIFGKREGSGGGRSPGVDQGGLHYLILFAAAADKGPAVVDEDSHLRTQVEPVAFAHEPVAHDGIRNDGVDLDRGDIAAARRERRPTS